MYNLSPIRSVVLGVAVVALGCAGPLVQPPSASASPIGSTPTVATESRQTPAGSIIVQASAQTPAWSPSNPARVGDVITITTDIVNVGDLAVDQLQWGRANDAAGPSGARAEALRPGERFNAVLDHSVTADDLRAGFIDYTVDVRAHWVTPAGVDEVRHVQSSVGLALEWVALSEKVALVAQVNGQYVSADGVSGSPLIADRANPGSSERFLMTYDSDGTVSLKSVANGLYVTAENGGGSALVANRTAVGPWEKFTLVSNGDGTVALKAEANGRYVTAGNAGAGALIAGATAIGAWERFVLRF